MDDDNIEADLVNLFDNCESDIKKEVLIPQIKPSYEPIHLPLSIIEIIERWNKNDSSKNSSNRICIGPCDLFSLDRMFIHTWGERHVEQPSRLTSIINYFYNYFWINHQSDFRLISGKMITDEEILLAHSKKFLQEFLSVERGDIVDHLPSMRTLSYANAEYNFQSVGPIIACACRIAAGTIIHLISSIIENKIHFGFAFVRPAGHHSSTDQVGTFCGLNSISIGARYAIEILQLDRVLILDWDVHRSGGTQEILEQISNENRNRYRLIDIYAAFGKCSNLPNQSSNCYLIDLFDKNQVPGDNEYIQIFDLNVIPDIIQFSPSIILISAGFDAAQGESDECAQLTPNGYYQMTRKLKQLNIPLVFVLEGGYQQQSLIQSIGSTLQALLDP